MHIAIYTQYAETTPDGATKMRGGENYQLPVSLGEAMLGNAALERRVQEFTTTLINNEMAQEFVMDWELKD